MQCLSPIYVKDKAGKYISASCGKCYACLSNYRNSWTFRLKEEERKSTSSYFVTLTYDDLIRNTYGNVDREDCQKFMKRLRYYCKIKFKYYLVSEYGSKTFRPHYHALLFFRDCIDQDTVTDYIQKSWQCGFIQVGKAESASIHYVTKYIIRKSINIDGLLPTFTLMSKGIGIDYVKEKEGYHNVRNAYVVHEGGLKGVMPRYYKDKIYSETEKRLIAEANIYRESDQDKYLEKHSQLELFEKKQYLEEKKKKLLKTDVL